MSARPEAQDISPDDLSLGTGAASIAGERFGLLTALRVVEKDTLHGNKWLCRCDCGRYALRFAGQLRYAAKLGREPQCSECQSGLRAGAFIARSVHRSAAWVRMFKSVGVLYSESLENRYCREITAQVAATLGFEPDPPAPALPLIVMPIGESQPSSGQRAAFLVPRTGRAWRCGLCRQLFSDGFGCTVCLAPVCPPCVRLELHLCDSSGADWDECMTPWRANQLPLGEPLHAGTTRIVQAYLPDADRIRLLDAIRPSPHPRRTTPRRARRAEGPRQRVVFDWTDFHHEPLETE